jgi:hypothetical protein
MGKLIYYSDITGMLAARDRERQAEHLARRYTTEWQPAARRSWKTFQAALPALGLPFQWFDCRYLYPPTVLQGLELEDAAGEARVGSMALAVEGMLDPDNPGFGNAQAAFRRLEMLDGREVSPRSRTFQRIAEAIGDATSTYTIVVTPEGETRKNIGVSRPVEATMDGAAFASFGCDLHVLEAEWAARYDRNVYHASQLANLLSTHMPPRAS